MRTGSLKSDSLKKIGPLYLLMLPSLILLLLFFYYPAISGFFYSFSHWSAAGARWIGLGRNEAQDVRMVNLQHPHVGPAPLPSLSNGIGSRVEYFHKGQRARGLALGGGHPIPGLNTGSF